MPHRQAEEDLLDLFLNGFSLKSSCSDQGNSTFMFSGFGEWVSRMKDKESLFHQCKHSWEQDGKTLGTNLVQEVVEVVQVSVSEGFLHNGDNFLASFTMKERNTVFLQVFLPWTRSDSTSYFCLIVWGQNLLKEVSCILLDPASSRHQTLCTKTMMFVQSIICQALSLKQLIISLRLNQFMKTFIRKKASFDTLAISRLDFRHDNCSFF